MSTILAIDPSIKSTGYAIVRSNDEHLIECGRIRVQQVSKSKTRYAHTRINEIIHELEQIHSSNNIDEIVVEITSGKTSSRHKGSGAGLSTYGMLVGHVVRWSMTQEITYQVYENDWTKGSSKGSRQQYAHARYPGAYTNEIMENDKGADISDAITLALKFIAQRNLGRI